MTVQQEILPPEGQDMLEFASEKPETVLLSEELTQKTLARVREVSQFEEQPDMNTAKGRDLVRSAAAKVAKFKSHIDKSRLEITAEKRREIAEINASSKVLIEGLAEIQDEVRAPLTAWETAEKAREELVESTIARIKAAALVTISDTAASVSARGNEIYEIEIDPEVFRKRTDEATEAQAATIKSLHEAMNVLREREEAQAELAKMKAVEAERLAKEAEELRQREAAEAAARAEQEAKEREERLKQEAADKARRDAEQAAEQARLAAEREAQRQIDEANERAAAAERAAQAERDRIAAEKAEEQRIAAAQAAEEERRQKNAAHRRKIMGAVKQSIMEVGGITEEAAMAIVRAMAKGNVPHVVVQF